MTDINEILVPYDAVEQASGPVVLNLPSIMRSVERCGQPGDTRFEVTVFLHPVHEQTGFVILADDGAEVRNVAPKGILPQMLDWLLCYFHRENGVDGIAISWVAGAQEPSIEEMEEDEIERLCGNSDDEDADSGPETDDVSEEPRPTLH